MACPLCLTPPCYHLEPPATAAPFCVLKAALPPWPATMLAIRLLRTLDLKAAASDGAWRCEAYPCPRSVRPRPALFLSVNGWRIPKSLRPFFATAWPWSRRRRAISTAPPDGIQEARTQRGACLCDRKHAADHALDAASVLAAFHRAVKEGEMTLAQASKEKSKVRLAACEPGDAKCIALLPAKLQELIAPRPNCRPKCGGSTRRCMRRCRSKSRSATRSKDSSDF